MGTSAVVVDAYASGRLLTDSFARLGLADRDTARLFTDCQAIEALKELVYVVSPTSP
jgi:hypothetical protein